MSIDEKTSALIKSAVKGDIRAFEELIMCHEKIVYNIAYRMLPNQEDVKDISQEVFIKVYKNLYKFDFKSAFSTWIYRITVNTCIDEIRKRKGKETYSMDEELQSDDSSIKKQYSDNGQSPEDVFISNEESQQLVAAVSLLSEEHQTIITLRDLEGFSYSEITEITGISMGTVKSRLARARLQLKNILLKNREHIQKNSRQKVKKGGEDNEM